MRSLGVALVALLAAAQESPVATRSVFISGEDVGYVDPIVCSGCHRRIYDSYRQTAMGRSFYRIRAQTNIEDYQKNNTYYHEPSDRHYTMYERAGRYYQRRYRSDRMGRSMT